MHRLIMNAPEGLEVDHINHDPLDNRRANLRLATRGQNARNKRKFPGTTSKYKGVHLNGRGKWASQIACDGVHRYLGSHSLEIVAALAYDHASLELHQEFGLRNFSPDVFASLWAEYGHQIQNPKKRQGTSRYVGVYQAGRGGVWRAQICVKNKTHSLGTFKSEEEAYQAREARMAEFRA